MIIRFGSGSGNENRSKVQLNMVFLLFDAALSQPESKGANNFLFESAVASRADLLNHRITNREANQLSRAIAVIGSVYIPERA